MEALYKTVYDLNRAELNELKEAMYYEEGCEEIYQDLDSPLQIQDESVYNYFEGINFVDEDFFCNID